MICISDGPQLFKKISQSENVYSDPYLPTQYMLLSNVGSGVAYAKERRVYFPKCVHKPAVTPATLASCTEDLWIRDDVN